MSRPEGEVRVLLVDDQELVRSGLRLILRRRDGFVIAGECGDGAEVPGALAANPVDVIVMDLRMKRVDGIEATRRLRRAANTPPVLALTTFDDDELLAGALRAGVTGYVLKDSSAEDLIRAVRTVAAGEAWLDTSVTARVLSTYRQAAPPLQEVPRPEEMTPREFDVLRAVGRGLSNAEIAAALSISELTVKSHLGRVLTKLDLRDRAAAIVYAFDNGIVAPSQIRPAALVETPSVEVSAREPEGRLRLAVLGPLRAWRGDRLVDLGPVRQQAMLAALLLRPDVTVSQQELLADVWGLDPPGTGGKVVPVYLYRLRKCLQANESGTTSVLDRDRSGYRFAGGSAWVDVAALEELTAEADAQAQAGELDEAVRGYERALELFQGEPLAGLPGPFAAGERLRLTERRLALSLRTLAWRLRLGECPEAVGELSALSHAHPHSEPIAALLMRALYLAGRRADALATFTSVRRRLVDDLGMEPGDELRRVQQAVLNGDDAALAASAVELR
jgi:DNA-binding NarL/FixJ family response regulator/DNA-binding SARP family transcriptional activator